MIEGLEGNENFGFCLCVVAFGMDKGKGREQLCIG